MSLSINITENITNLSHKTICTTKVCCHRFGYPTESTKNIELQYNFSVTANSGSATNLFIKCWSHCTTTNANIHSSKPYQYCIKKCTGEGTDKWRLTWLSYKLSHEGEWVYTYTYIYGIHIYIYFSSSISNFASKWNIQHMTLLKLWDYSFFYKVTNHKISASPTQLWGTKPFLNELTIMDD